MPIPRSAEGWAAITPNVEDTTLVASWQRDCCVRRPDDASALAAASRLLERDRVENEHVDKFAAFICDDVTQEDASGPCETCRSKARRILGVA